MSAHAADDDFLAFYRRYARTGIHAAAAALLTLFGLLASVADHWGFIAVGVAVYALPPAYLYLTGNRPEGEPETGTGTDDGPDRRAAAEPEPTAGAESDPDAGEPDERTTDEADERTTGDRATDGVSHGGASGRDDPAPEATWEWWPTSPPTDADLADAVAAADGVYAAGSGGVLFAHRDGAWETVLEDGAGGDGADFTAAAATSDGRAVWAVGDGGAVARYDVDAERCVDRSAPNDLTSTWSGVAVAGAAGEETVYLANGSGVVVRGVLTDDETTWSEGFKPGTGSSIASLSFSAPQRGVVCDTAGDVFETADGDAFERIGVDDPAGTLTAVLGDDAAARGASVLVADDAGALYERRDSRWSSERPADAGLFGLAAGPNERLAVGEGGTVLVDDGDGWTARPTPVETALRGVALVQGGFALAVGDGGTAVERRRGMREE